MNTHLHVDVRVGHGVISAHDINDAFLTPEDREQFFSLMEDMSGLDLSGFIFRSSLVIASQKLLDGPFEPIAAQFLPEGQGPSTVETFLDLPGKTSRLCTAYSTNSFKDFTN